jgi:hypothetical protein
MNTALILAGIAVLGVGGVYWAQNEPVSYEKEVKVETVEVEVETLSKRITEAQEASKADIEAKAKEAYDKAVSQALLEIELEVTATYRQEIEAREAELEQNLSF